MNTTIVEIENKYFGSAFEILKAIKKEKIKLAENQNDFVAQQKIEALKVKLQELKTRGRG